MARRVGSDSAWNTASRVCCSTMWLNLDTAALAVNPLGEAVPALAWTSRNEHGTTSLALQGEKMAGTKTSSSAGRPVEPGSETLTGPLLVVLGVVVVAGLLFGYDQGVISGALDGIKRHFSAEFASWSRW